jgi:hypothetical protein
VRILSTTEKLRAHHREWLAAHYAPLATLYPDHDYGPAMRLDPRFCALHLSIGLQFLPSSARLMATMPDVMLFFNHAGGSMVMTALLRAAMEAGDPHTALAYAEVGDRFGISRTHVRRMHAGGSSGRGARETAWAWRAPGRDPASVLEFA